jgi:hypothetical protein
VRKLVLLCFLGAAGVMLIRAQVSPASYAWIAPASGSVLPKEMTFADPLGRLGVLNAEGPVAPRGTHFLSRSDRTAGRASPATNPPTQ